MKTLAGFLLPLLLVACAEDISVPVPVMYPSVELAGTEALSPAALNALEGVYEVIDGQSLLGREAVVRHAGGGISSAWW